STTSTKSTSSINTKTSIKSETPKQTTAISTSSKITTSSTTYSLKTETIYVTITGFTTTYKTALYTYTTIVTTKKTTSSSQISGGGGGGREGPLLRDSLLSNKNVYKEFLDKIKKIENKRQLPMLYLVYKVTPLKVEQYPNYKDMIVHKIRPIIKNYDNEGRDCVLSIGKIGNDNNGFFLIKPIVHDGFHVNSFFDERNIEILMKKDEFEIDNKISFYLKANGVEDKERQIFFLNEESLLSLLPSSRTHSLNLYLYVYYNGELKPVDCEPEYGREGEKLSFFGEVLYSSMIAIGNALSIAMLPISSGTSPVIPLFFIGTGTQDLAEYLALKKSLKEASESAKEAFNELVDVYRNVKSKPEANDYVNAFVLKIIDIIDPTNVASGIIIGDLELTLPKQMFSLFEEILNPNLSMKERAKAIGTFVGLVCSVYYSAKTFKKELSNLKERFSKNYKDKYEIIKKSIDDFSHLNTRLAAKTTIFLDKIASKFGEEAKEESVNTIKVIKLLINNKIKIDEIIDDIENAINKIDDIEDIEKLIKIRDEIILNKLKAVKIKIYEGTGYQARLNAEAFKKIGGKIPPEGKEAWAYFEGFTLDGTKIEFIKNIGRPDEHGRIKVGGKLIHDKVQTNEVYAKLIGMIENSEDFYKLFKENIGTRKFGKTIVELTSLNEMRINTEGNVKVIKLEEIGLRWDDERGTLGIALKFKTCIGEEMIEICTDGGLNGEEGAYMKVLSYDEGELHGRRIYGIKWDEEEKVLKIAYGYEGNIVLRRIFFEGETSFKKIKLFDEKGKIKEYKLIDNGRIEQWFSAGKNTKVKGNIAELWGKEILEDFNLVDIIERIAEGGRNDDIADLDGIIKEKRIPGEVKSFDGTGLSLNELKRAFKEDLKKAIEDLHEDFTKKGYNSEYGYAIIFGLRKDYENNEIIIDVLIVKVNNDLTYDYLYTPTWWKQV
ncbi:MAG: hypothetical protein QXP60_03265, partial [Nitrososphaerota archaeon]